MKARTMKLFGIAAALGSLGLWGCQAVRAGYETAPYTVVKSDGKFEVRDYPGLLVVETPMSGGGQNGDGSFNRLFRFISGNNESNRKIAMTTPVFMSGGDTNRMMAFVLPAEMKPDAVPRPGDGAVSVRELPAGRFAVLRFSGERSAEQEAATLAELRAWLKEQALPETAAPVYGYFDPPWTPSALRRNEVMMPTTPGT